MRSERNLNIYTFENVAFNVLKRRYVSGLTTAQLFAINSESTGFLAIVFRH